MAKFYPSDYEFSSNGGDQTHYGRKKSKEYERMQEYIEAIENKKPKQLEHFSTMLAPTAKQGSDPIQAVRSVMAKSEAKLRKERSKKISKKPASKEDDEFEDFFK